MNEQFPFLFPGAKRGTKFALVSPFGIRKIFDIHVKVDILDQDLQRETFNALQSQEDPPLNFYIDYARELLGEFPTSIPEEVSNIPLGEASDAPLEEVCRAPFEGVSDAPFGEASSDAPLEEANDFEVRGTPFEEVSDIPLERVSNKPLEEANDARLEEASNAPLGEVAGMNDGNPDPRVEPVSQAAQGTANVSGNGLIEPKALRQIKEGLADLGLKHPLAMSQAKQSTESGPEDGRTEASTKEYVDKGSRRFGESSSDKTRNLPN
jgi:hypothetical protein